MTIYRVYFTLKINCLGVTNYAKGHITVNANSEIEAISKIKNNISINYFKTEQVKEY